VLVAVSGGPDSMAMLALAARVFARNLWPGPLHAASFDHGLRPESAGECRLVARFALRLGVPHHVGRWTAPPPPGNTHAAARLARYAFLIRTARGAGFGAVLTAHTLDDQAETVVMRLARTIEPRSLAGVAPLIPGPPGWPDVRRPFLAVPGSRLAATALALGAPFVRDPANADPRFERSRVRAAMPALAARGIRAARLADLAARAAAAVAGIEDEATRFLHDRAEVAEQGEVRLDMSGEEAGEVALAALRRALIAAGGRADAPPRAVLERLLAALLDRDRRQRAAAFTLAGTRLRHVPDSGLSVVREWGRAGPPDAALAPGGATVWDGRFLVRAPPWLAEAATIRAFGHTGRGNAAQRTLPALFLGGRCLAVPASLAKKAPPGASADLDALQIVRDRLLDPAIGGLYDRLRLRGLILA